MCGCGGCRIDVELRRPVCLPARRRAHDLERRRESNRTAGQRAGEVEHLAALTDGPVREPAWGGGDQGACRGKTQESEDASPRGRRGGEGGGKGPGGGDVLKRLTGAGPEPERPGRWGRESAGQFAARRGVTSPDSARQRGGGCWGDGAGRVAILNETVELFLSENEFIDGDAASEAAESVFIFKTSCRSCLPFRPSGAKWAREATRHGLHRHAIGAAHRCPFSVDGIRHLRPQAIRRPTCSNTATGFHPSADGAGRASPAHTTHQGPGPPPAPHIAQHVVITLRRHHEAERLHNLSHSCRLLRPGVNGRRPKLLSRLHEYLLTKPSGRSTQCDEFIRRVIGKPGPSATGKAEARR